jgi:hypothetical protein
MVHDNCPAGVIVTGGLGGSYQDWIIAQFRLFIGRAVAIEVEVRRPGRGVPHGLEGTQYDPRYHDRWRRRDDDDDEPWTPPSDEKEVIFKVRVGSKEIERHYFRKDADRVIKAINLANKTKDNINVTVDKIKDTTRKAGVSFKGFLKKKNEDEEDKD